MGWDFVAYGAAGRYEKGITRRSHGVWNKTFNEETPMEKGTFFLNELAVLVNWEADDTLCVRIGERRCKVNMFVKPEKEERTQVFGLD